MSQPPSSWDPHAGQQAYPQGPQNPYGSTEQFPPQGQQGYTPPPPYGGYPPPAYGAPYGQQGYPPPYGGPAGGRLGPQRPGAALAGAVLSYIQAGIVLVCSFFVLAAGTASTEALLIGILQLISVGILIFGAVQLASGTGRILLLLGSGIQLALVIYYLVRFQTIGSAIDLSDGEGFLVVIPLFFAVMPSVAIALALSSAVARFLGEKRAQVQQHTPQWGQ